MVLILIHWQFRLSQYIFYSVCHYIILIRHQPLYRFLILLRHCWFPLLFFIYLAFALWFLRHLHSRAFLRPSAAVRLFRPLWLPERQTLPPVSMVASLRLVLSGHVADPWLGCRLQPESSGCGRQIEWVLRFVTRGIRRIVTLLRDKIVDTLFKLHLVLILLLLLFNKINLYSDNMIEI